MKPLLINLDILWNKNKDVEFPDNHLTPYMFIHKESYQFYFNSNEPDFLEELETIDYWIEFYKNASIQDMLENKNSWIMVNKEDFSIHDGYHRLISAKLAKKEIIVSTLDVGNWQQGKPK